MLSYGIWNPQVKHETLSQKSVKVVISQTVSIVIYHIPLRFTKITSNKDLVDCFFHKSI
jgi:hypothetical protein